MVTKTNVIQRLKKVMDPELHISIVDLGLIYDVSIRQHVDTSARIRVVMTLTTPRCPLAPVIDQMIKDALADLKSEMEIKLVWEPVWTVDMMSEEGKLKLEIL